ncbi:glycosyltransferase [Polynucleobacter sp. 15G-AUS-farblos]|uniref:glycosyltransferase family 2 protein n=1 Tax=Polynucleobacter sp. 15G-AUS-farblos TaxID=2689094 RepID=UPI001C0D2A5D|nr:glycosyltransferase [Polynucleobacter sp. 15G-AUS-farblos]MBU3584083.1 glycosyltransferase [Polynucleobacter sp. 15G-AUS-farblos]
MKQWSPKVSIIIPAYNAGNYLRESINSAINQSYTNNEIIVINDGSNDSGLTEKIALSYGEQIKYFSKPNGGCASALNLGISKMTGEYFSWLSHDDLYKPNKLASQINFLRSIDNNNAILFSGYDVINENGLYLYSVKPSFILNKIQLNTPLAPLMRGLINGCTLLIPKNLLDQHGQFNERLLCTQDYEMWFKLFRVLPVYLSPGQEVLARVHQGQASNSSKELALREGNTLWIGFLDELTEEEMIEIDGSVERFLLKTSEFLTISSYLEAANYADTMRDRYIESNSGIVADKVKFDFGRMLSIASSFGDIKLSIKWVFWLIKQYGIRETYKKILYALRK